MVVTSIGGGCYIRSLATVEEIELLDKKKSGLLKTGIDTLGRYNLVVVSDGNSGGEVLIKLTMERGVLYIEITLEAVKKVVKMEIFI